MLLPVTCLGSFTDFFFVLLANSFNQPSDCQKGFPNAFKYTSWNCHNAKQIILMIITFCSRDLHFQLLTGFAGIWTRFLEPEIKLSHENIAIKALFDGELFLLRALLNVQSVHVSQCEVSWKILRCWIFRSTVMAFFCRETLDVFSNKMQSFLANFSRIFLASSLITQSNRISHFLSKQTVNSACTDGKSLDKGLLTDAYLQWRIFIISWKWHGEFVNPREHSSTFTAMSCVPSFHGSNGNTPSYIHVLLVKVPELPEFFKKTLSVLLRQVFRTLELAFPLRLDNHFLGLFQVCSYL